MKKQTTTTRRRVQRKPAPSGLAIFRALVIDLAKPVLAFLRSTRIQRRVRRVQLVERLALSNKHSVTVLRVDDREFMVGCTGESMVLLSALGAPCDSAHESNPGHLPANQPPVKLVPSKEDLERAFRRIQ